MMELREDGIVRAVRSQRVVCPDGIRPATVIYRNGLIEAVLPFDDDGESEVCTDHGDLVVMPGVVDTHVHLNEPGRTAWEGFASATRAAAAGGITTLIDMPLNCIPATVDCAALAAKRDAAAGQLAVDVGFWGGVVPGNVAELEPLVKAGVRGFKCFLIESGVPEFGWVGRGDLLPAMRVLAKLGVPLLCHAEVAGPIDAVADDVALADPRAYQTYLSSRPPAAEEQAIALLVELCRQTGCRVHIVHHSAASALPLVAAARAEGLPLTAETCPHYLHFAAEDVAPGSTPFKCAPPIRERSNQEALWAALADGTLDSIVSDHSPCTAALKGLEAGDFLTAWGGIAGLQLSLSVAWSNARRRGHGLDQLVAWMCRSTAVLAGLEGKKGALAPGFDADIVVFDPDAIARVRADDLYHRNAVTPYDGAELTGVVVQTILRGVPVFENNRPWTQGQGQAPGECI